jgi:hypothetical protein
MHELLEIFDIDALCGAKIKNSTRPCPAGSETKEGYIGQCSTHHFFDRTSHQGRVSIQCLPHSILCQGGWQVYMGRSARGKGRFVSSYEDFTRTPLFLFYINYFQSDIIHYPPKCKEQTTNIVVPWRLQHRLLLFFKCLFIQKKFKEIFFLGRKVKNLLKYLFFIITPS